MELKGTVLNVVDFGAFVDIGLKDSGLVHISQLANRYIKSPHDVVSVGDVVTAWVMGVDHERKRVSLTMVKPGTERPRGPQGGGGSRRGGQEPREGRGGGERRQGAGGGGRPPRRESSSLPPQPAGPIPGGAPEGAGARRPRGARAPAGRSGTGTGTGRRPAPGRRPALRGGPGPRRPEARPWARGRRAGTGRGAFTLAPAVEAGPSAPPAVEGGAHGQRPAPDVRPAQAVVAGPRRGRGRPRSSQEQGGRGVPAQYRAHPASASHPRGPQARGNGRRGCRQPLIRVDRSARCRPKMRLIASSGASTGLPPALGATPSPFTAGVGGPVGSVVRGWRAKSIR